MKILVLGDLHIPYVLWDALAAAHDFSKWYKPDVIIQVGDLTDQGAWSRFDKDTDQPNPHDEWLALEDQLHAVHRLFGTKTPWLQLEGNHCRRIMHRATGAGIPKQLVRTMDELFPFKNWKWHISDDPLIVDGIAFVHGDESAGSGIIKARRTGRSLVQGHDHIAYLEYIDTYDREIFGMSVGCLLDRKTLAARYARRNLGRCWIGWATITDGEPHLYSYRRGLKHA